MSNNTSTNDQLSRRRVLKKTATATVAGGIAASGLTGTAAAAETTLTVNGGSSTGWSSYQVVVDDPYGTAGSNTESDDTVTQEYSWGTGCYGEHTLFEGTVYDGYADTYHFDGTIQQINVSWDVGEDDFGGDVYFDVEGGIDDSIGGYINAYHSGEGGDYEFCMSDSLSKSGDIEDADSVTGSCADGSGCCGGFDYYECSGELTYASIQTGGDGYIELTHTYPSDPC